MMRFILSVEEKLLRKELQGGQIESRISGGDRKRIAEVERVIRRSSV